MSVEKVLDVARVITTIKVKMPEKMEIFTPKPFS